jgi:hypothetical protein
MRMCRGLMGLVVVLACGQAPGGAATEGSSTSSTSDAPTTTTTTTQVTSSTNGTTGVTTGDECFIGCGLCAGGEIAVEQHGSDFTECTCEPNPEACVPSDPCSPACAAVCSAKRLCGVTDCGVLVCSTPFLCEYGACEPEGKCAPSDTLGEGTWSGSKCVPVAPDAGQVGAACTVEGGEFSGEDTCDIGLLCVDDVCVGLCELSGGECAAGTVCVSALPQGGGLCLPVCDPLASGCVDSQVCVPLPDVGGFVCVFDGSGDAGQDGDACEYGNECDPGLACVRADVLADCADTGCCSPFCALDGASPCVDGEVCAPFFGEEPPPAGYEDVGVCRAPA